MATYNSVGYAANQPALSHGLAGNVKVAYAEVVCSSAPSTADTLNFFTLPKGARIVNAILEATDMDTGGPTLTINIGDSGSATRLFSASTVGQAGTAAQATAVTAFGYQYTADTVITGTAGTNATTGAAGSVYLTVLYVVEGLAS
jgi:hypothetical protein